MQSFSLPGESQKAAKILGHFLGKYFLDVYALSRLCLVICSVSRLMRFIADPSHPQTALNSVPKAVLLRAKGTSHDPPLLILVLD